MKTIFHDQDIKRVSFLDNRYYSSDGGATWFPSVTTILSIYPKGHGFEEWLKSVGFNAQHIVDKAAAFGSKIHNCTEDLNKGMEIKWVDDEGKELFTLQEWQALLKYAEFWKLCSPKLIANEDNFVSPDLRYGGTLDRVVMIAGVRWLVDIKTSNHLHKSQELQLAAYAELWNHFNPDQPIEQTGILWLKAATKTQKIDTDKQIYQGVGWQLKSFDRHYTDAFRIFKHTQAIWEEENPNYKPANLVLPDSIKL